MRNWLSIFCFWVGGIALGWLLCDTAHAAPLLVQAHYLNTFHHTLETTVTVNLKAHGPGTAKLTARGLQLPDYSAGQKEDAYTATVVLHKGLNHFKRRFYVARWDFEAPGYGAALHPFFDRLVPQPLNAVSVELAVGGHIQTRVEGVSPERR